MKRINGITKAAKRQAGKSQKCDHCRLRKEHKCSEEVIRECFASFVEGFKKGAKYYKTKQEKKTQGFIDMANKNYGTNIERRLSKLNEELNELKDAIYAYFDPPKSGNVDYTDIKDEMGDVLAVMTHLCSLIGTDPSKLFWEAVEKIEGRKKDPNYKRKHPHIRAFLEISKSGDLCAYCSYMKGGSHYPGELCEGRYCEEAYEEYKEKMEAEYETKRN